jgi:hypothetical protein
MEDGIGTELRGRGAVVESSRKFPVYIRRSLVDVR